MYDKLYVTKRLIFLFFCMLSSWLTPQWCIAQNALPTVLMEWMEETALQQEEKTINWEELLEELQYLQENPLNLNAANRNDLERLPFISAKLVENIQAYIYIKGEMKSLHELLLVEHMDRRTMDLLMPFVCVKPLKKDEENEWRDILRKGKSEILARVDIPFYTSKGYSTVYQGPSYYHSLRYNFHFKDKLYVGLTAEKDAGEPFGALHNRKGYDYYGVYALLQDVGRIRSLALGNYKLHFGQGLIVSNNFLSGKSLQLSSLPFEKQGIRRHASTDEYNYFSGIATSVELTKQILLSAFYSYRKLDGTLSGDTLVSINKTGLHRTKSEVNRKNNASMQVIGGNLSYKGSWFRAGATGIYYYLDRLYIPQLPKYAKYYQQGQRFYNIGFDYSIRAYGWALDGEIAKGTKGIALLNRLQYSLGSNYHFRAVHRLYTHDYWGFFANAFGESSSVQNENGWYLAADISPISNWRFFGSIDFFSFPWWRYRLSKPSQGIDFNLLAEYTPYRDLTIRTTYRLKKKERDMTGTGGNIILPYQHHRLRAQLNYNVNKSLALRTTVDYNNFYIVKSSSDKGWQLTQRAAYSFSNFPLQCEVQLSYFNTTNYDARIYIPERGLLYSFYTPSFAGSGWRYSAWARYDFEKRVMLILKYGETNYNDRDEIGSGNDHIASHRKGDIQIQLRVTF